MNFKKIVVVLGIALVAYSAIPIKQSYAVSQWARKYSTSCSTCHTAIPRLNYYGERFMRNGFQDPDNEVPDGDTEGKKLYNDGALSLGKLEDYFGVRVSFQPVKVQTKGLKENGKNKTLVDIGKFNWIQLFTAGTVAKNVSFFNELQFTDTGEVDMDWTVLGFHNLLDSKLVNFEIGKISPVEWTSFSNRLRIFPDITALPDKVKSSSRNTAARQDSVNISSEQFGINYYGYQGSVIWLVGIGNSSKASDVNQEKNFWGSVRYEINNEASKFEGSSVSMFAYRGTDTAAVATAKITNNYYRLQPSLNVRWNEKIDAVASFHYANEDNINLNATPMKESYWGATGIFAYMPTPKWQTGMEYDTIFENTTQAANIEDDRLAFRAGYLLRENIYLIATADTDFLNRGSREKNHQFFTTVRMMW